MSTSLTKLNFQAEAFMPVIHTLGWQLHPGGGSRRYYYRPMTYFGLGTYPLNRRPCSNKEVPHHAGSNPVLGIVGTPVAELVDAESPLGQTT